MEMLVWVGLMTFMCLYTRSQGVHVSTTYRDIRGMALENMDFNPETEELVLGAGDSLTKLSNHLSVLQNTKVKGHNSRLRSYSKGVVIDRGTVLVCTSYNSTCEIRLLSNLNYVMHRHTESLVPSDQATHNLIFVSDYPHQTHFVNDFRYDGTKSAMMVPTISSRVPQNLSIVPSVRSGGSEKFAVLENLPAGYSVEHVYTFDVGSFLYIILRRPSAYGDGLTYSTRIARKCMNDPKFRSYVDVQLDCLANAHIQYPLARAAHYDKTTGELFVGYTTAAGDVSALCIFTISDINKEIGRTIVHCNRGEGNLGPLHFHKKSSCVNTRGSHEYCGETKVSEMNPSIEGVGPVWQRPVIVLPNTVITSILNTKEGNNTKVVYLGSSDGMLKKVTIQSNGYVSMVGEVTLDLGQEVYRKMFLDNAGQYLYAMTKTKVLKVSVDHCAEKMTCQACMSTLDAVCGWCVMENRCSHEAGCPVGGISPRWLPARNGVCAQMRDISPQMLSYRLMDEASNGEISFKLDKIQITDPSSIHLHCSFNMRGTKELTAATIQGDRINCPLPPRTKLPTLPQGIVHQNGDHTELEVEFQAHGRTIVKREWVLNDCRINQNCTGCTSSPVGCKWCHKLGMCVEASEPSCPNQTSSAISSSGNCPRLEVSAQDTDILVHSGQTKSIAVRVANLQPDQTSNVHCVFTFQGQVMYSPGSISSANLLCDPLKFKFNDTLLPIVTAEFTVTSGSKSVPLDNPQQIKVRIYKCGPMVTNCGQCLSVDPGFVCGWCTETAAGGEASCSLQTDCPATKWLDRTETCPNPQILRFNPQAGPIQGKTNISVTGLNLGRIYSDLEVTVAGRPCIVHAQNYESSQRFECEVVGSDKVTDGVIKVIIQNKYTTVSDSAFMFVEPQVTSLSPKRGPLSGGTTLSIFGNFMNAGTMTTVDVGGSPCAFVRANISVLECVTSQQTSDDNPVEVNFGNLRKLVPEKFTYEKDPLINKIEPTKTILSGGLSITAIGNQMQLIQKPQFFVEVNGQKITSPCVLQPLTSWLVCKTPRLQFPGENITETSPKEVHYGFNLDGVTTYRNISADPNFGPLLYYPDPAIETYPPPGKDGKKQEKDNMIVIKGNFRRISPVIEDVNVFVGGAPCTKPQASDDAISCQAPDQPIDVDGKGNAVVFLQIGNMRKEVGYISYLEDGEEEKPIAAGIILGVVLPMIAIILLLTICVIRRHRKHKPSDNYIPDVWKDTEGKKEDEEIGMNHVSVKADMNGSIPDDKDTEPYIEELLGKIDDDAIRHNVKQFLISRKRLDIGDLLGKGNFGVTYKATYSRTDEDSPTDMVVKTIQGNQTDSTNISEFLQTVTVYKDLQHPGIAQIVGVCITHSDDPMIVAPYAQNGDLKSYVRDSNRNVSVLELLEFGHQVSEAMAYLESVHIVHGNLALRNCLVTDQKKVQVADYGLTKELFNKESYFKEDDKLKNLVKWAAPETMETVAFTSKSDVWSGGVTVWELLTRGVTPYPDVENSSLAEYLQQGNRMKKPRQCPETIYELMLQCWNQDPESRPTFRHIADELHKFITSEDQSSGDTTPLQKNIDVEQAGELI